MRTNNLLALMCALCGIGPARSDEQPPMPTPRPPGLVQPAAQPEPKTFEFRMKDATWDDVLDWYAKTSGLTLITTVKPSKGTFTFEPAAGKKYPLEEITDIINEALEPHKMILIRRHQTFFIHSTDERIDGPLLRLELADLPKRSKREIVQVIIPLTTVKAGDIADDVKKLLGAHGTVVPLDSGRYLLVQDTVGNLREIVKFIQHAEEKADDPKPVEKTYTVNFVRVPWEDVLDWYAKVSGLKADLKVKPVGPLTLKPAKDREFTVAEITDLLNEALAQQQLLLVPHHKSFTLLSTEGKIDPKHVPAVELKDLPKFGRSAIVEVAIPMLGLDGEDVADELKKLLTPWGEIVYAKGKWVIVRDTVGNIRRMIETLEPHSHRPVPPASLERWAAPRSRFAPHPGGFGPPAPMPQVVEKTYTLNMKNVAWDDVTDWYAKTTGLQLVTTVKPEGQFSFTPAKPLQKFTVAEITDIFNDALAAQKLILIRRHQTFFFHRTDEKLDAKLIPRIELSELPNRGRTEIVQVLVGVSGLVAADIADEVQKLLGPLGSIFLPLSGQLLLITDTTDNIAKIRKKIDEWTNPKREK